MWISRIRMRFSAILFIFLLKFAEIAENRFLSSVKFIRRTGFKKYPAFLWKTPPKPPFFPQRIRQTTQPASISAQAKNACQHPGSGENCRWKRDWKTYKFQKSKNRTQNCAKSDVFSRNTPVRRMIFSRIIFDFQRLSTKKVFEFVRKKSG